MTFGCTLSWMETKWWKRKLEEGGEETPEGCLCNLTSPPPLLHFPNSDYVNKWCVRVTKGRIGQRVNTWGPQRGGQIAAYNIHDRFQVSIRPCITLETTDPTSTWHPQLEISTPTCDLELWRALWSHEHPAWTCTGASTASLPNWAVRPVSLQAAQLRKPHFDEIRHVFHFWNNDMVPGVGVQLDQREHVPGGSSAGSSWLSWSKETLQLWRQRAEISGCCFFQQRQNIRQAGSFF